MNIFVTGHKGYIGSHLVKLLQELGHFVCGCDIGLFDDCQWMEVPSPDNELIKDIRNLTIKDLASMDCVIHLAALSNDPMGAIDPGLTKKINYEATLHVAKTAKKAGVNRFLFASSCSMYGKGDSDNLTEDSPLNPVSAYAESKILSEQALSQLGSDHFTVSFLRNATAYGSSPMLRTDLVINNLMAHAFLYNEMLVLSDGSPWRPLIHCFDIASAFTYFLQAPHESIHKKAFNIGGNNENYQVKEMAELVHQSIPEAGIKYGNQAGPDPRNYRVNFDRLSQTFPTFKLRYTLPAGIKELHSHMITNGFDVNKFERGNYTRLDILKKRLSLLQ